MWDDDRIETVEQLRSIYRSPADIAANKDRPRLDDASRRFIERSRFMLIGTHGADGSADVSPRGGPSGFVLTLDDEHLAIADLGGNNRLDSMTNIVDTGRVGLLFIVPGQGETVRVNGAAWITTSAQVLDRFALPRRPKAAVVVRVETTYVHCAKAIYRSGLYNPEAYRELADTPDGAAIMVCQGAVDADLMGSRERLDDAYARELAYERTPG